MERQGNGLFAPSKPLVPLKRNWITYRMRRLRNRLVKSLFPIPSHPFLVEKSRRWFELKYWTTGISSSFPSFTSKKRKKRRRESFLSFMWRSIKRKKKKKLFVLSTRISFVTLRKIFSFRSSVYQTCVATIKTMPLVLHTPHILYWFIAFADRSINLESHSRFNIPPFLILLSCIFTAKYFDEKDPRTSLYE